jgi:hypothetical protein
MNAERVQALVQQLQAEVGQHVTGNGSLTLHFQAGKVQAVELNTHTRVPQGAAERRTTVGLDSPPLSR